MASLYECLFLIVFVCRFCCGFIKTNIEDLEHIINDEVNTLSKRVLQGSEPGVAVFHQYVDINLTVLSDSGLMTSTLVQDGHIQNLTLQFSAFEKRFLLDLSLANDLFGNVYTRKILHNSGHDMLESLQGRENCYYQGHLRDNPASHAALSSCDGFRGYLTDGRETYHIDPVSGSHHRIFRNKDFRQLHLKCGTSSHDVFHPPVQSRLRKKRNIREPYDSNKFTRYVELYMVNDFRTFERHGKNATTVFKRSQDIANIVNSLYRQLNIYIVLVGVEVWSTGDKVVISSSADTTMENFLRYRKERINPYHPNDNAQLITGITFDHGVVGKAIKGPICTHQFSGGVSMDYDGLVTLVATTMAHEMGHNFGMEHDNDTKCSCPQDKCIMAATSGQVSPHYWSSCSQNALHEAFDLGMDYCLRNPPITIYNGPICGNGFVEGNEQCDCGLPQDCNNRCCNATTCMLQPQAQCATGRCCDLDTCMMRKQASLCREPTGECDLPEFCDGATEFCPPDVFMQDGGQCANGQSYCYKGSCRTLNAQCQLLWGNTGRVSDPICFQQLNTRGDHDGNCGYNWTLDRYQACDRENVMCGLLHCVHLNEKLMFWRDNLALDMRANFLTRGNTQYVCRSTMLDVGLDMPDPGLVPDGAKCEDSKICIKQKCTPLMKLKIPQCPDCNGNGMCNSEGNCHCHVGYAPPLCDRPGYGGSINSGPASNEYAKKDLLIGLLVLFLVILPVLVLVVLALINRRRLLAWWKRGPGVKFGVLKKPPQAPSQPPQPRPGASQEKKRWSSAPTRPVTNLEISGPLMEDTDGTDVQHSAAPGGPPPYRPVFKPSANKPSSSTAQPKATLPAIAAAASKQSHVVPPAAAAAVPTVAIVSTKEHRNIFMGAGEAVERSKAAKTPTGSLERPQHPPPPVAKSPNGTLERPRPPPPPPTLPVSFGESTLKRKEKDSGKDQAIHSPPLSPTKGSRKGVQHSQSCREPRSKDLLLPGEKLVKRESFRGAEISSPVLVSTTNRDSQVFADFQFDESGIIARPTNPRQPSVHGANPSAEVASDGCRSPVRRCQSDRPLSPKKRGGDEAIKKVFPDQVFSSRPLPPEPVVEVESEPLYINEGLSDLEDLKAQISSAFDTLKKTKDTHAEKVTTVDAAPKPASASTGSKTSSTEPVSQAIRAASTLSKPSIVTSTASSSRPSQSMSVSTIKPSNISSSTTAKPATTVSSSISSKGSALERVLNNPLKPFGNTVLSSGGGDTSSKEASPQQGSSITKPSLSSAANKPAAASSFSQPLPVATGDSKPAAIPVASSLSAKPGIPSSGSGVTTSGKPSPALATSDLPASKPFSLADKPGTGAGVAVRGPFGSALNRTPLSATFSKDATATASKAVSSTAAGKGPAAGVVASDPPASSKGSLHISSSSGKALPAGKDSASSKVIPGQSTGLSSKGAIGSLAEKGTAGSVMNKGPTSAGSKTGTGATLAPAAATSRPVSSTTNKAVSSSSVASKGPTVGATAARTPNSGAVPGRPATSTSAVSVAGTTSNPAARASLATGVQRSASAATSRPNVAPKPGAKAVRSYNF